MIFKILRLNLSCLSFSYVFVYTSLVSTKMIFLAFSVMWTFFWLPPPLFCFSFCPFHSLCWQGRLQAVLTLQVKLLAEDVSLFLLSPFLHVCCVLHRIPLHVPCGSRGAFGCCEEPRLGRHYRGGEKSEHLQEDSPGQRRLPRRRALTCPVCLQLASPGPGYRFPTVCKITSSI